VADSVAGEGEVLVNVEAVGVNYRDVYEREGNGYGTPPPAIIGIEAAGTVAGTGERVAWVSVPASYAAGVAAVYDGIGASTFREGLRAMSRRGG
jgi:NADPH:quinone reductase